MPLLESRAQSAKLDLNLFAHIHNDARIMGTFLQGQYFKNTSSYALSVMKYLETNDCGIPPLKRKKILETLYNVEENFSDLGKFENLSEKARNALKTLSQNTNYNFDEAAQQKIIHHTVVKEIILTFLKNGSVLIPGGWTGIEGKSGHAMCYKLEKQNDGSILFLIYNTGAGIEHHQKRSKSKEKYIPVKAFRIPPQVSGREFELEQFVTQLLVPNITPILATPYRDNKNLIYDADRVYHENIAKVAFLGGQEIDPSPYCKTTTQGQLSGTCAMRVLMPLLHGEMQGEVFQEFLYQFRLQSIIDFYKSLTSDELKQVAVQLELRSALEKFSRLTHKLLKRKRNKQSVLSEKQAKESLDLIETILQELKLHTVDAPNKPFNIESAFIAKNDTVFSDLSGTTHPVMPDGGQQEFVEPKKIPTLKEAGSHFNLLKISYQRLLENDRQQYTESVLYDIEQLILSFPLAPSDSEKYWGGLSPEQAKESLSLIQNIIRLYGKQNYLKGGNLLPQVKIINFGAMLTASSIANQYFKNDENFQCLSDIVLAIPLLQHDRKIILDPHSVSMDPVFDAKLAEIENRIDQYRKLKFKDKDGGKEFYDIELIEKHDALSRLCKLGPPLSENPWDNARMYLYKLANGSLKGDNVESARKELYDLLLDLDCCTQFSQIQRECIAMAQGQFDFFKSINYQKMEAPQERLRNLNFENSYPRTLGWKNLQSNLKFSNGDTIPSISIPNPKTLYQIENPIMEEMLFALKDNENFLSDYTYESNQALVSFEEMARKAVVPEYLKRELLVHSIPFTRIRTGTTRIVATFDFFDQNLDKLNQHDYQMLFLLNLLTPNILTKQLTKTPVLADKMVTLLEKCFKRFSKTTKIENGGVFALKASYYLLKYFKAHPQSKLFSESIQRLERTQETILAHIETNNKILLTKDLPTHDREDALTEVSTLHRLNILMQSEIIAEDKKLSQEKIASILNSVLFKSITDAPRSKINDGFLETEVDRKQMKLLPILSRALEELPSNDQMKLIKNLLDTHLGSKFIPEGQYDCEIKFPLVKVIQHNEEILTVDLSTGSFKKGNKIQKIIPNEYYTLDFIRFFGNKQLLGEVYPNQRICEFTQQSRRFRVLLGDSGNIIIQYYSQELERWLELQDSASFEVKNKGSQSKFPRHFLENGKLLWLDVNDKKRYYITDKNFNFFVSMTPQSEMTSDKESKQNKDLPSTAKEGTTIINSLNSLGQELGYKLVQIESLKNDAELNNLIKKLFNIESPGFIELWTASDSSVENTYPMIINMPRFGLEFYTQKNSEGKWDLVWKENSKYKLSHSSETSLGNFNDFLLLEDRGNPKDRMILVPEQVFYTQGREEDAGKPKTGILTSRPPYYQLIFDKTHEAANARVMRTPDCQWKFTEESVCKRYKLNSAGDLLPQTPAECLHLAYVCLATKQHNKALDWIHQCKKMGGIKGSYEEVEWINNIVNRIPDPVISRKIYLSARANDPETLAVRLHALHLLVDFKRISLDTPLFLLESPKGLDVITDSNQTLKNINNGDVSQFYKNGFSYALSTEYVRYHKVLGNVPTDMQLSPDQELPIVKQVIQQDPRGCAFLANRSQDLDFIHLVAERGTLAEKQMQGKRLSEQDQTRFNEIQKLLKEGKKRFAEQSILTMRTMLLVPSDFKFTDIILNFIMGSNNYHRNNSQAKSVSINHLSLLTSSADFLFSFSTYYKVAIAEESAQNKIEKQKLLKYVEGFLAMKLSANTPLSTPMNEVADLCGLLYYALKFPSASWPKFDNIHKETLINTFELLNRKCSLLFSESPLSMDYINYSHEKTENVQAFLPKKSTSKMYALMGNSSEELHFNLAKELDVENFQIAVHDIEKTLSVETLDASRNSGKDKLEFTESERAAFNRDLAAGQKYNQIQKLKKSQYLSYLNNAEKRNSLLLSLGEKIEDRKKILNTSLQSLEVMANRALTQDKATLKVQLQIKGKEKAPLSFRDLMFLFLEGDRALFKKRTLLGDKEIDELHHAINHFLVDATALQKRERAAALLKELEGKGSQHPEYMALLESLGNELTSQRQFSTFKNPEMLIFEYYQNTLIRAPQSKMIAALSEQQNDAYKSQILQLIMGGGKSKVLLPILALKKANGTNLSIIEVHEALFKTSVSDLNMITQKLFGKTGYAFVFDRETNCQPDNLTALYEKLSSVIKNREYLIITPDSIQSLEMKYLELIKTPGQDKKMWESQVLAIEKIQTLFKTRGAVIIDEVDLIFDPKRELNFTVGANHAVPEEISKSFIELFNLFPEVKLSLGTEMFTLLQVSNFEKSIPNEKMWSEAVAKLSVLMLTHTTGPLSSLFPCQIDFKKREIEEFLLGKITELPKEAELVFSDREKLSKIKSVIEYIQGKSTEIPKFIFDLGDLPGDDNDLREKIALAKAQLQFLPFVLKRNPNEHFGLPHTEAAKGNPLIAIPYVANNTPNEKAEFGTIFETIFYTLRLLKDPNKQLPPNLVRTLIDDFKTQAENERLASLDPMAFEETHAAQEFKELTGLNLMDVHPNIASEFNNIQNNFSQQQKVKDYCLLHYVLSHVKYASTILRSDAVNHASQFQSVQGFTGTPWNYRCYHPSITFDLQANLGIDGQTIDVLQEKKPTVQIVESKAPSKVISEIFQAQSDVKDLHAFIDVGALFKGISNDKVSQSFAEFFANIADNNIQHILYFNKDNQLCALPIDRENKTFKSPVFIGSTDMDVIASITKSRPEQCFTFYDQRHTTGVDIVQPTNAIGFLSLDKETSIRDYLQGALRMRKLAAGQNIRLLIPKVVVESRPDIVDWNAQAVLEFTLENQNKKLSDLHFQAALKK